ncbi:hypothetical protein OIU74_001933 [Salix koriyanagi]|uniref:Uncharacterized protein n=1 Tax=Salix koriyanagi TaxID=2511006 RepID=A0A9Q0X2G0_9ROSI|nr:hypothetical protein OIU74_001933 [Salix koriyanagi]
MRRRTWDEKRKRQAQGLCFNCSNVDEDDPVANEPKISLHALIGWSAGRTTRIAVKIRIHELTVLIDPKSQIQTICRASS